MVFLKQDQRILLLEVSCPEDVNVVEKEREKIRKYPALVREMDCCYEQPVDIVPIVFGHTGVISKHQRQHLKKIPFFNDFVFDNLQKAALLGTIAVMRSINFSCVT